MGKRGGRHATMPNNTVSTEELASIVFGRGLDLAGTDEEVDEEERVQALPPAKKAKKAANKKTQEPLSGDEGEEAPEEHSNRPQKTKVAWVDPDDEELQVDLSAHRRTRKLRTSGAETVVAGDEYERRLRKQFQLLHGDVRWGSSHKFLDDDEEDDEELSEGETGGGAVEPISSALTVNKKRTKGGAIPSTTIDIEPYGVLDAEIGIEKGQQPVGRSVIQALQFNPTSELMLVGGLDYKLRIYSVDGGEVTKLASHHFSNYRLQGAAFTPTGNEVIVTSDQDMLVALDVKTGMTSKHNLLTDFRHTRYHHLRMGPYPDESPGLQSSGLFSVLGDTGNIIVCDIKSKQPVRTLRMPNPAIDSVFVPDRNAIYSIDTESHIYEWDLGKGRCTQRVKEPWAVKPTCLAVSRKSHFSPQPLLAVGMGSGVIDFLDVTGPKLPKLPMKSVDNLTMSITNMCFHPQGEVLVASSRHTKSHVRLIHSTTTTVYQNWPVVNSPLKRIVAADFTRQNGLLAIANKNGKVLLYQLQHYVK
mmetsp:Transcript_2145/g.4446  ORF Transcript_2145/g.4446 Transcript_2145/m.4446 type:complete len:530 (+) Transcript_2145:106-1695(+)